MHHSSPPLVPVHVLHVDDDAHILEVTKAFLERSGHIRVSSCSSVQEAFEHLTEYPVDVFISDYEMPEMSGIELLQTIRGHGCDIPFILFTGRGRESVAVSAINSGATFYVQKGGEPRSQYAELSDKVMKAYRQYRDQQKLRHLSRIFQVLREVSDTIHGNEMREEVFARLCSRITSEPGYQNMRIVLFDANGNVSGVYHAGLEEQMDRFLSYLQAGNRTSCYKRALQSRSGPVICAPDETCVSCPLYSGHHDSHTLTVRLEHAGTVFGIVSVTLEPEYARDPDEQAMVQDVAREISYALHHFLLQEEHKEMENLIGTNKKLDILNTITRHDIRNELTAQLFHYDNLLELSHKYPEIAQDVKELGISLNNIQEHLMFSDVYQKIGIQKPKWLSISRIIENIKHSHEFGNVSILHSTGTLEVYTDPMFGKIVINLVENALMHGCRVSAIQIRFVERIDAGLLIIEDDGMGIPDNKKKVIFERGVGRNSGLGLFYTREILGMTGMSITENGTYGKGARFEICIPKSCYRFYKGEELMNALHTSFAGQVHADDS
ncbi:response regulator [Methanospirillum hungatei]|uniref:hybrid sensor histidine kinase/response regulator n=1 Tax=Methanospirillum hungatei TaxID=2203 RepID=UPI0026EC6284|nr:response regulator [Methanospirillum hungatei]MCA1915128.1 response regulator [Methanospirillum hungatei]